MPLYIRDEDVNELAGAVRRQLGTKTKTEAVRFALTSVLKRAEQQPSVEERVKLIQDRIAARMGPSKVEFDEKTYMDEMWGE